MKPLFFTLALTALGVGVWAWATSRAGAASYPSGEYQLVTDGWTGETYYEPVTINEAAPEHETLASENYDPAQPDELENSTMTLDQTQQQNLTAFLEVIRKIEANGDYQALVGGGRFEDFSGHPANFGWAGVNGSRAAGGYQIQPGTMKEAVKQAATKGIVIQGFSPAAQDAMAIEILQFPWRQNAYADVLTGNFDRAVLKLVKEWEAFEKIIAGQYPYTLAQVKTLYAGGGGTFA